MADKAHPPQPQALARTFAHAVLVYRERQWPHQWIGRCTCGKGIRCNSEDAAWTFLENCLFDQSYEPVDPLARSREQ